jgi:hypothetical protein
MTDGVDGVIDESFGKFELNILFQRWAILK